MTFVIGRGFIMLLSGEPGVGKTLTAESGNSFLFIHILDKYSNIAVAEEMRKPLYCISAGELGELASAVEESLETILELSAKWGAILLLDECDIFLEQRTRVDIQRNRLVSSKWTSELLFPVSFNVYERTNNICATY
jgi:hypothetical protein